ncbi:MAG: hypothetical protein ABEL76_12665 [Bradymonadaceae bacterium]
MEGPRASILRVAAILTLIAGVAGCEKSSSDGGEEAAAKGSEATSQKQVEDDDDPESTGSTDVSKKTYVKATARLACVDMKLRDKYNVDKLERKVFQKLGIDSKGFQAAEAEYASDAKLEKKIEAKIENCTEEKAETYAGVTGGGGGAAETQKEKKKKKGEQKDRPAMVGTIEGEVAGEGPFDVVRATISIEPDFTASGSVIVETQGRTIEVPVEGEVSDNDHLQLSGKRNGETVDVEGELTPARGSLEISGTIAGESIEATRGPDPLRSPVRCSPVSRREVHLTPVEMSIPAGPVPLTTGTLPVRPPSSMLSVASGPPEWR